MPEHTPPGPAHPGLYLSHPACLEHDPRAHMPEHPDTPERLQAIERALAARDWLGWERRTAPPAEEAQLELVHSTRTSSGSGSSRWPGAARSTPTRSSASPPTAPRCTPPAARVR